jgi:hypothetical protein
MGRHWLLPDSTFPPGPRRAPPAWRTREEYLDLAEHDWLPYLEAREAEFQRLRAEFPELGKGIDAELGRYRALRGKIRANAGLGVGMPSRPR